MLFTPATLSLYLVQPLQLIICPLISPLTASPASMRHQVLDASFLYSRPDAHQAPCGRPTDTCKADCLHFAAPGAMDTIGRVLLNELEQGLGAI